MADVASGGLGRWILSRRVPINCEQIAFFFHFLELNMCSKLIFC